MLLEVSYLTLQILNLLLHVALTVRLSQLVQLRFIVYFGDDLTLNLQIILSNLQIRSNLLILSFQFTQLLFLLI